MMRTVPKAASPRARKMMSQRGIDPATIVGSGPNGRIVEADVLRAVSALPAGSSPISAAVSCQKNVAPAGSLSPMRRAVAAKVAESFATVPHFYLTSQVDVTALVEMREKGVEDVAKRWGQRPSMTDFILRAMAVALGDCPQANRIWLGGSIVALPSIDVGLVTQVNDGLLVPIIHNADRLGLIDLVRRRVELTEAVRSGRAPADALQGGATSLSNLGRRRVDAFAPIISPPQSSMLAVGRVAEQPAVYQGQLAVRQIMHLTLAVDHRVMDGVPAAEFLDRIVELLENPFLLFCAPSSIPS